MDFNSSNDLQAFLDQKAVQYNNPEFIQSDPIQLPKRFKRKEDIEIVAFLVATIAWGNRKSIITSGERILEIMHHSPFDFIQNYEEQELSFVHRTFNSIDLNAFFVKLKWCYQNGGLEHFFNQGELNNVRDRIIAFRNQFTQDPFPPRTLKHISNPATGSAAKRINMYKRVI